MQNKFPLIVGYKTLNLLIERRAILYQGRKAFYVWSLPGRVVVLFDTEMIDLNKLNEDFAHKLSTRLNGRLVVRTNSRGLFLQVASEIPPALLDIVEKPLNLEDQPSPFHMPVGMTGRGDLWKSLLEGDSFFVTGMRGMGKTGELHGMIQALLHGGSTKVFAWDGKDNAEFLRYVGHPNFTLFPMHGLQNGLHMIQREASDRLQKLAISGHANTGTFNAQADPKDVMMPMALFIDEVAEVEDQSLLLKQVKLNRAAGLHPIFATNDPSKSAVIAKSNLVTRICFSVPSPADSSMALGQTGANHLPNQRGRGLIVHNGRLVEFQSFTVDYPAPTDAGLRWLVENTAGNNAVVTNGPSAEIVQMAESIRADWKPNMSKRAVGRLLGLTYAGGYTEKIDSVIEFLTATTTNTMPQTGLLSPNQAAT